MTDYRAAAISSVLVKEMRALLGAPSHDNATRCVELMDRLREHYDAAFNECLRQDDDPKLKAVATFVAGIPKRADRQVSASRPRSEEVIEPPKPRPVQAPQGAYRVDFDHHAARETAGGRFGAVNEFVAQGAIVRYPRQPANSPWASDLVGNEPALGYDINAVPSQEPMKAAPTTDELLKEIARLREALEEARSGGAPETPAVEPTLESGESCPLGSPLSSPYVTGNEQKES